MLKTSVIKFCENKNKWIFEYFQEKNETFLNNNNKLYVRMYIFQHKYLAFDYRNLFAHNIRLNRGTQIAGDNLASLFCCYYQLETL